MLYHATFTTGRLLLREMEEFGQLPVAAQRYIRRSLAVRDDNAETLVGMSRTPEEARSVCRQIELYRGIDEVIAAIPVDDEIASISRFTSLILPIATFDVGEQKIESFAAFRFLYERLLGASARSWLPTIFMMIASLPELHPDRRIDLLGTVGADAVASHCSSLDPQFFPEWIEDLVD